MTVAAILRHKGSDVVTVEPTMKLHEIAELLMDRRIGAVLVLDRAEQILGIVSERDIVRCLAANGACTMEMTAGQVMMRPIHMATPRTTVIEAMREMTVSRCRHMPVVEDGALAGIISIGDVVKARILQQEFEVESLRNYVSNSG